MWFIGNGWIFTYIFLYLYSCDTDKELEVVRKAAIANGAVNAIASRHWSDGGVGAIKLAEALIEACNTKTSFQFLYELNTSIEEKIIKIAKEMYGAGSVEFNDKVKKIMEFYTEKV